MHRFTTAFLTALSLAPRALAQHPFRHPVDAVEVRYARTQPVVRYTLRVDSTDLTRYSVEIRIRGAGDTFHLAMVAHPEYDDRFFRYLEDLRIEAGGGNATIVREDSVLWRVGAPGGEAVVRYRIHLPAQSNPRRSGWIPFLSPTGGLVGGPHSFMYMLGAELAPSYVTLELPAGWDAATGLESTADPAVYFAPSVDVLIDSPVLVGRFRSWRFSVDGVPHRVIYWPLPDAAPFDTAAMVSGLERLAREAVALFGRAPYREYTFMLQDGAVGALEHLNSVSIGAPSASLAQGLTDLFAESAHEYFHTWNLMRIRPIEYRGVDYRTQPPVAGLWWSEGLTMFYADLLLRRAGLPTFDSTRTAHLAGLIGRYLASPGNSRFSAEQVSRVAYNAAPGALGDYDPSTHLQGELLGTMLDLIVRDATDGRHSMEEVMRAMLEEFSGERGFTGRDIERTVARTCGCRVAPFFDAHVRSGHAIDFNRYLSVVGLRLRVTRVPAMGRDGRPAPDLRLRAWLPPGETAPRLLLGDPASLWGRAGLHTGDRLTAVNGAPVASPGDFRRILGRLAIGDTLRVEVTRPAGAYRATVAVSGYDRPWVVIEEIPGASPRQQRLRRVWLIN
jgi:predicted metalloprotease with PDZ domain